MDTPKAPMNPAWVSVLRYSCRWAARTQNALTASAQLTERLNLYGAFTRGFTFTEGSSDLGETFYLRTFIENGIRGQCNDFADFLLCLMTSLGVPERAVQRTHSIALNNRRKELSNGVYGSFVQFATNWLRVAPYSSGGEGYYEWIFHQFCLNPTTQRVWDAAFRFWDSGYVLPDNMLRDQEYRDRLVRYYLFVYPEPDYSYTLCKFDPAYYWVPTPDAGFIPSVTANDIPPTP